jgi:hypothetical protein
MYELRVEKTVNEYIRTPISGSLDDSSRISFLRIVLVALLVLLHFGGLYGQDTSPRDGFQPGEHGFATLVASVIGFSAFAAVPTLSAISGYLFFRGTSPGTMPDFGRKFRSRVRTLVVPLAIWGSLGLVVGFLVRLVEPNAFSAWFDFGNRSVLPALVDSALGITGVPFVQPLWFLRDLVVTVALSPVIWFLVGRAPIATTLGLVALWIAGENLWIFLRLDCLVFFTIGAALALHRRSVDLSDGWTAVVALAFLALVLARSKAEYLLGLDVDGFAVSAMMAALRIVGALAAWNLAALAVRSDLGLRLSLLSPAAFFVFCAHYPAVEIVKELTGRFLKPENSAELLAHYIGVSVSLTIVLVVTATLLRRWAPGLSAVLVGPRGT